MSILNCYLAAFELLLSRSNTCVDVWRAGVSHWHVTISNMSIWRMSHKMFRYIAILHWHFAILPYSSIWQYSKIWIWVPIGFEEIIRLCSRNSKKNLSLKFGLVSLIIDRGAWNVKLPVTSYILYQGLPMNVFWQATMAIAGRGYGQWPTFYRSIRRLQIRASRFADWFGTSRRQ